ncbi:hypothetical protein BC833DRAFT_571262 [Globomyces pollinis-pini]|nr:hypothetical protein BC833DRAFT_571262 [Globomyces pollinis-pini]
MLEDFTSLDYIHLFSNGISTLTLLICIHTLLRRQKPKKMKAGAIIGLIAQICLAGFHIFQFIWSISAIHFHHSNATRYDYSQAVWMLVTISNICACTGIASISFVYVHYWLTLHHFIEKYSFVKIVKKFCDNHKHILTYSYTFTVISYIITVISVFLWLKNDLLRFLNWLKVLQSILNASFAIMALPILIDLLHVLCVFNPNAEDKTQIGRHQNGGRVLDSTTRLLVRFLAVGFLYDILLIVHSASRLTELQFLFHPITPDSPFATALYPNPSNSMNILLGIGGFFIGVIYLGDFIKSPAIRIK